MKKSSTILTAGLVAAFLDITSVIIIYTLIIPVTTAERILQSVAAGAFGKAAYEGGWNMALAGLLFHTFVALVFAAFYMLIYPYWKKFFNNPAVAGFFYGICVWCVMNLLVLPLISGKMTPFNWQPFLIGIGLIIFMVGIPIALITERYYRTRQRS
jgi:uncharacterized membrane protein YagU involved in acid resistance